MNTRTREICRAMMMRERPDYFALLRCDDGKLHGIFVPQSDVEEYKAKYGDALNFLFHPEFNNGR